MKFKQRRYRLFADWKLQGHGCVRICVYWLVCQGAMLGTIFGFLALGGGQDVGGADGGSPWRFIVPAIVASSLFLPVVLLDHLRFTNKFVGPLVRLRRNMKELAEGNHTGPLNFRPDDYLLDLPAYFNEIQSRLAHWENQIDDSSVEDVEAGFPMNHQLFSANCSESVTMQ